MSVAISSRKIIYEVVGTFFFFFVLYICQQERAHVYIHGGIEHPNSAYLGGHRSINHFQLCNTLILAARLCNRSIDSLFPSPHSYAIRCHRNPRLGAL